MQRTSAMNAPQYASVPHRARCPELAWGGSLSVSAAAPAASMLVSQLPYKGPWRLKGSSHVLISQRNCPPSPTDSPCLLLLWTNSAQSTATWTAAHLARLQGTRLSYSFMVQVSKAVSCYSLPVSLWVSLTDRLCSHLRAPAPLRNRARRATRCGEHARLPWIHTILVRRSRRLVEYRP